jgi:hypothetical protein
MAGGLRIDEDSDGRAATVLFGVHMLPFRA